MLLKARRCQMTACHRAFLESFRQAFTYGQSTKREAIRRAIGEVCSRKGEIVRRQIPARQLWTGTPQSVAADASRSSNVATSA